MIKTVTNLCQNISGPEENKDAKIILTEHFGSKRANYLVSEKIYELFSLCSASLGIDENEFDEKIKDFIIQ